MSIVTRKAELRKSIKQALKVLDLAHIVASSTSCAARIASDDSFMSSKIICCYLSMETELRTNEILEAAFAQHKRVFVPKVVGSNSEDMKFFEVRNMQEIHSFPKTKWGIPEPPVEPTSVDITELPERLDFIVLPGVAFDYACNRLGHGKGYYGIKYMLK